MTRFATRLLAVSVAIGLTCACEKRSATQTAAAGDLLARIPADSPFAMISTEPLPRAFTDWLGDGLAPLMDLAQSGLDKARGETTDPVGRALLTELDGKLSRKGFESMGISLEPRFAIYAIGFSLAIRVELASGARLEQTIARIEQHSGRALDRAEVAGVSYRELVQDDVAVAIAVLGDELVVGIMHANARSAVLPILFGKTKPARSLADAGVIDKLRDKYELSGIGLMYLDMQAIARMFTGEASSLTRQTMAASGVDLPRLSPVCQRELAEMAAIAPRAVFGYREIKAKQTTSVMAIELRDDLARQLMELESSRIDLSALSGDAPLFSLGLNVDVGRTIAWAKERVAAVSAKPYQCEHFKPINDGFDELRAALDQPLPPGIDSFQGAAFALHSIDVSALAPSGTGYAAVALDDTAGALALARSGLPMLANLDLTPDGTVKDIPLGPLGTGKLIVRDNAIGVSLGKDMQARLTRLMNSKPGRSGPAMVVGYDYGRLLEFAKDIPRMGPEQRLMIDMITKLFGKTSYALDATADGVVMTTRSKSP